MTYKPEGYTSVASYLIVRDAEATLSFVETVFPASRLRRIPRPGGGIMHAEIRVDDTVVMMGEMPDASAAHVHVYVPDAVDCFDRAVAAGGQVVQPVEDQNDGDLRGGVADPNGVVWWVATQKG